MSKSLEGRSINELLRHLGCGQDFEDFPGTASEKLALVRTACTRGLIGWSKARRRYEVTPAGWTELMPRRRYGVASLMISAAAGGIIGAAALGVYWLPADGSHRFVRAQSSAPIARAASPGVWQISRSAEPGSPRSISLQPVSALTDDIPVVTSDAEPGEATHAADPVTPGQAKPELASTDVKQGTARKSRHRTAHHRRREQGAARGYAARWGGQQFRYAGYREGGAWFGYR